MWGTLRIGVFVFRSQRLFAGRLSLSSVPPAQSFRRRGPFSPSSSLLGLHVCACVCVCMCARVVLDSSVVRLEEVPPDEERRQEVGEMLAECTHPGGGGRLACWLWWDDASPVRSSSVPGGAGGPLPSMSPIYGQGD